MALKIVRVALAAATPKEVVPAAPGGQRVYLKNVGANPAEYGQDNTVAAGVGFPQAVADPMITLELAPGESVWAVSTAGSSIAVARSNA